MRHEKIKTRRWLVSAIEQSGKPNSRVGRTAAARAAIRRKAAARARSA